MHDILEGVLQYHTKELLKLYNMEKMVLSTWILYKRILSFDYGRYNDSNKPAQILRTKLLSNDNNLRQHGKFSNFLTICLLVADL